ncbi:hypothetical protein V7128_01785 [Neobacillus vireti]
MKKKVALTLTIAGLIIAGFVLSSHHIDKQTTEVKLAMRDPGGGGA